MHEGFSEALGLPLQTADGKQLFVPKRTRYYRTDGAWASWFRQKMAATGCRLATTLAKIKSLLLDYVFNNLLFVASMKIGTAAVSRGWGDLDGTSAQTNTMTIPWSTLRISPGHTLGSMGPKVRTARAPWRSSIGSTSTKALTR